MSCISLMPTLGNFAYMFPFYHSFLNFSWPQTNVCLVGALVLGEHIAVVEMPVYQTLPWKGNLWLLQGSGLSPSLLFILEQ